MRLNVSSKNEYFFYPEIGDNLEKPEEERFTIVIKKVNQLLSSGDWFRYDDNAEYLGISIGAKLKSYIKKIVNAPILKIDNDKEREMQVDDLISDEFPELFTITTQLNNFILKIEQEGEKEIKKS